MNEFYGKSLLEELCLDYTKYRGIGRPRKIDYSTLKEVNKRKNSLINYTLDKKYAGSFT